MVEIKLVTVESRECKGVGGLTEKGKEGTFWGNKSGLYTDWEGCYMVYTFVKTHQTDYLKYFHLFYVNYTFKKLIKKHTMRSEGSVLESVGFSNRRPHRS